MNLRMFSAEGVPVLDAIDANLDTTQFEVLASATSTRQTLPPVSEA